MAECGSCGAEIIWAYTKAGKRMPLDAEPVMERGIILETLRNGSRRAEVAGPVYVSHFSTCPDAAEHRKPR